MAKRKIAGLFLLDIYQKTNCQAALDCRNQSKIPVHDVIRIDASYSCFRVPFDKYEIRHLEEVFIVRALSSSLPNRMLGDSSREIQIYFLASNTTISNEVTSHKENSIITQFDWATYVNVAVSALYRSLRSLNRCSEFKTHETCMAECRVELFRQMCSCTPTSWSNWAKSNTYEECKLKDYVNCVNYSGTEDKPCIEMNCSNNMELCERSSYTLIKDGGPDRHLGGTIHINVANFDYPIYEEQHEFTLEDFTAAIGGAIGFYLGIDFFIIVNFIIEVVSTLWKMIVHRFFSTEQ